MIQMRKVVLSMALLGAIGCKATAEGEQKTWNANEEKIQQLEGKYPSFKPALEDLLTSAKKDFDAAKGNPDQMDVANNRVASATDMFKDYEAQSDRLQKLMKDPVIGGLPANQVNPLLNAAQTAMTHASADIHSTPANIGEAKGKIADAVKTLSSAADPLDAAKKAASAQAAAPAAKPTAATTTTKK